MTSTWFLKWRNHFVAFASELFQRFRPEQWLKNVITDRLVSLFDSDISQQYSICPGIFRNPSYGEGHFVDFYWSILCDTNMKDSWRFTSSGNFLIFFFFFALVIKTGKHVEIRFFPSVCIWNYFCSWILLCAVSQT